MRPSSGTYSTYLSDLRTNGYITETDHMLELTPTGAAEDVNFI